MALARFGASCSRTSLHLVQCHVSLPRGSKNQAVSRLRSTNSRREVPKIGALDKLLPDDVRDELRSKKGVSATEY